MRKLVLTEKEYRVIVLQIEKLETQFGYAPTRAAIQRYLNIIKGRTKRERTIAKLRAEITQLEGKT